MIKKRNIKKIKGFVMNRKTGHTSYAFNQKFDTVDSVGFTHNVNDFADKRKLKFNIDPNDKTDCYVKTKIEKQRHNEYRRKENYKSYRIHEDDKPLISEIINKNKKRR